MGTVDRRPDDMNPAALSTLQDSDGRSVGQVCGAHDAHQTGAIVDDRNRASVVEVDQIGSLIDGFVRRETGGIFHDIHEFESGSGVGEGADWSYSDQFTVLCHDRVLLVGQEGGVGDAHIGSERCWRPHDLVDTSRRVLDDNGSTGGSCPDAGTGSEELALEPGSAWGAHDEQRPSRQFADHGDWVGDLDGLDGEVGNAGGEGDKSILRLCKVFSIAMAIHDSSGNPELSGQSLCEDGRQLGVRATVNGSDD